MSAPLSPSGGNDQKAQVLDLQELVLTQIGFVDAFDKYLKTACKAIPMSLMVQKGRILEAVQKRDFERAENLLHALEDQRKPDASREIMNSLEDLQVKSQRLQEELAYFSKQVYYETWTNGEVLELRAAIDRAKQPE